MPVFNNILAGAAGSGGAAGYEIERSLRFNSSDSAHLSRTPSSAGNRKTWTWSGWVKRTSTSADALFSCGVNLYNGGAGGAHATIYLESSDSLQVYEYSDGYGYNYRTTQLFRDPGAWYHLVISLDTTNSTAADRLKIYVNGSRVTSFATSTAPALNFEGEVNNNVVHYISDTVAYLDGYLADVHFIDGQALAATDFGEYDGNNNWNPKAYSGTYGTNGFHLDFSDNSSNAALGLDQRVGVTQDPTGTTYGIVEGGTAASVLDGRTTSYINIRPYSSLSGQGSGVTLTTAITATSSVRIYGSSQSGNYEINGTDYNAAPTFPNHAWTTITGLTFPLTIYSFGIDGGSTGNGANIYAIEVDGTVVGGTANNWTVNNLIATGVTYSNDLTASAGGFGLSSTAGDAFDGTLTTSAYSPSGGSLTWTPSTPISYSSSVEAYSYQSPGDEASLNGGTAVSLTSGQWTTVASGSGTITSLVVSDSVNRASLAGIRVDGTILVDSAPANTDSLIDTPTNYEAASGNNGGNYATLNPLDASGTAPVNGNLDFTTTNAQYIRATMAMNVKTYFEVTVNTAGTGGLIGIRTLGDAIGTQTAGDSYAYHSSGAYFVDGANGGSWGSSYGAVDVIGIAYNPDDNEITAYINGTSQGTKTGLDSDKAFAPWIHAHTCSYSVNFGQRPFAHTPPTGYVSLCTTNLPDPTIADGSTAFDATLYTGNGSTQSISVANHSPDLVWVKSRNDTTGHRLFDTVRGDYKFLESSSNGAEATNTNQIAITSSGFDTGNSVNTNDNNDTYVAWTWDAGTSTASNTDGSITSSVRANASAGFSIVSYTGTGAAATVGHGLNAKPVLNIIKRTGATTDWVVYTDTIDGSWDYLLLNTTAAKLDTSVFSSNSSTFDFSGSATVANISGSPAIAYCWAPVEGFSAFGSYTGNGSTDGPFVYTGHLPRFVIIKRTDTSGNDWQLYDTARSTFNAMDDKLKANSSDAEVVEHPIDFLSNGFKPRNTANGSNGSGATYVYASFASNPFKDARAR